MTLRAIVTAGGTREWIDDVRCITNLSRGTFGMMIAETLAKHGVETTLLASADLTARIRDKKHPFRLFSFDSAEDLHRLLADRIKMERPDFVVMAAAVSDYTPVRQDGKIRSDAEEMTIHLRRNRKILPQLRELCGIKTFIVGFKLLSSVSEEELARVAHKQLVDCRTNLTVANDFARIDWKGHDHPILMVTPEGGILPVNGERSQVVATLVDFMLSRQNVQWFSTKHIVPDLPEITAISGAVDSARAFPDSLNALLSLAKDSGLWFNSSGNVSARAEDGSSTFWVSPRKVDKHRLVPEDFALVSIDLESRRIKSKGPLKSSIDSGVQAVLYNSLPSVKAFLHFHPGCGLVVPDLSTEISYPCGTIEEAQEILRSYTSWVMSPTGRAGSFCAELANHGFLLGVCENDAAGLSRQWFAAKEEYVEHLKAVGNEHLLPSLNLFPILVGPNVVGILAKMNSMPDLGVELPLPKVSRRGIVMPNYFRLNDGTSIYVLPKWRGNQSGMKLIDQLIERGDLIAADDDCNVIDFYSARGYKNIAKQGKVNFLLPPTRRTDVQKAATIALVNPFSKRVLMGKRLNDTWRDHFAFPGGRLEAGEDYLDAAIRELEEETRMSITFAGGLKRSERYVGTPGGEFAYHVTNFVVAVFDEPKPSPTNELDAAWFTLEEARKLQMGYGTRQILKGIAELPGT